MPDNISERYALIKRNITESCRRAGRNIADITIMAVTKTVNPDIINLIPDMGICVIGENRVQELEEKYPFLDRRLDIHLIGQLQTNKVKYIIDKVSLIHSADRLPLAIEIDARARTAGRVMPVLIEVNISGEPSKAGVAPEALDTLFSGMSELRNIDIRGLMTVAGNAYDPEDNRLPFRRMRGLLTELNKKYNTDMRCLSMGMSNDYAVAVEEGATIVRIGSALFGERIRGG